MIEVKYTWLCGHCQKKFVSQMMNKIKKYREIGLSYRKISKITGIPKSTIFDSFSEKTEKRTLHKHQPIEDDNGINISENNNNNGQI